MNPHILLFASLTMQVMALASAAGTQLRATIGSSAIVLFALAMAVYFKSDEK